MQPNAFDVNTPDKVKKEVFNVLETFLASTNDTTEAFVRKVGKNDSFIYTHEVRTFVEEQRITKKR